MKQMALAFAHWISNGFDHVFSTPLEDRLHPPPVVGVQPFTGTPHRRGRKG